MVFLISRFEYYLCVVHSHTAPQQRRLCFSVSPSRAESGYPLVLLQAPPATCHIHTAQLTGSTGCFLVSTHVRCCLIKFVLDGLPVLQRDLFWWRVHDALCLLKVLDLLLQLCEAGPRH